MRWSVVYVTPDNAFIFVAQRIRLIRYTFMFEFRSFYAMLLLLELPCILLVLVAGDVSSANIGKFWHITDHHWDTYYSQNGQDPMEICPSSYGRPISNAGPLGDYK